MNNADQIRREYETMRQQLAQLDVAAADVGVALALKLDVLDGLIAELEARGTETDSLLADAVRFSCAFIRATLLAASLADFQRDAVERFQPPD